jgi:transposase-like protein
MFVDKDEIRKLFKEGKLNNQEDFQSILSSIIKDVVETIYEGELTELLGYSRYKTVECYIFATVLNGAKNIQ